MPGPLVRHRYGHLAHGPFAGRVAELIRPAGKAVQRADVDDFATTLFEHQLSRQLAHQGRVRLASGRLAGLASDCGRK